MEHDWTLNQYCEKAVLSSDSLNMKHFMSIETDANASELGLSMLHNSPPLLARHRNWEYHIFVSNINLRIVATGREEGRKGYEDLLQG